MAPEDKPKPKIKPDLRPKEAWSEFVWTRRAWCAEKCSKGMP